MLVLADIIDNIERENLVATWTAIPPGEGVNYAWENDHIFVKVASGNTGGAFNLFEDNLKAQFSLGFHVHKTHTETFYIIAGAIDFYLDDHWFTATAGSTVNIPPGIPHAVKASRGSAPIKSLMIFQPGGFDLYLAELKAMTPAQLADQAFQEQRAMHYDVHMLGGLPADNR